MFGLKLYEFVGFLIFSQIDRLCHQDIQREYCRKYQVMLSRRLFPHHPDGKHLIKRLPLHHAIPKNKQQIDIKFNVNSLDVSIDVNYNESFLGNPPSSV